MKTILKKLLGLVLMLGPVSLFFFIRFTDALAFQFILGSPWLFLIGLDLFNEEWCRKFVAATTPYEPPRRYRRRW